MRAVYGNYQQFSFRYDPENFVFTGYYHKFGDSCEKAFVSGKVLQKNGMAFPAGLETKNEISWRMDGRETTVSCSACTLTFKITPRGLEIGSSPNVRLEGHLFWGEHVSDTLPGVFAGTSSCLQGSSGPAVRAGDDMLFDRQKDRALRFVSKGDFKLGFDWAKNAYSFTFSHNGTAPANGLLFEVREDFISGRMHMRYSPINKSGWFATAPVGWMTWYSVCFDAGEYEVLENTRRMKEILGKYTDNLVSWVDWEWYHADHSGKGNGDCDIFAPRKDAYPNGMAYVAEKIKEMGCIPAIWVAPSNEGHKNKWFEAHPECVRGPWNSWSGQWWVDFSRPEVLDDYIPMVMKQVLDWGYIAVKWDCLTSTMSIWNAHRESFDDQSLSTEQLQYRMLKAGRKALGDDIFMLFCNPVTDSDLGTGTSVFDAARIGGDVFGWDEFCERSIDRLYHFFPLHNTALYADGDNVVLRREFNTKTQARSRVSFYGISGMPVTVGDRFREYDDELIYMLRRIVPVVDTNPVEFEVKFPDGAGRKIITAFNRPFGSWQVAALINTRENPLDVTLDFAADCRLETGSGKRYAVYDYWNNTFLGIFDRNIQLTIPPFDTAVLRVTPIEDEMLPVLVSSSRHLTQGGYELVSMERKAACGVVCGIVKCVENEPCRLSFYVPEAMTVTAENGQWEQKGSCGVLTVGGSAGGDISWQITINK